MGTSKSKQGKVLSGSETQYDICKFSSDLEQGNIDFRHDLNLKYVFMFWGYILCIIIIYRYLSIAIYLYINQTTIFQEMS